MSNTFRYILPFTYFFQSRLKTKKDFLFHFWYEWLISFLLLAYNNEWDLTKTASTFLLGYLAFISIYELGYLANDLYAVRFEQTPRKRIDAFDPSTGSIVLWVVTRLVSFGMVSYYLSLHTVITWWVFYGILCLVYILHNVLRNEQLKIMTFFQLAFFRFMAPLFIFLSDELWNILLMPVLINYVFYRTLTYMESKGLTNIPDRKQIIFKVRYYLIFSLAGLFLSVSTHSVIPFFLHVYYLFFWIFLWGIARSKLAGKGDI